MSETAEKKSLDIAFQEYNNLKSEQTQRIGFRDNLLYVNLTVYGAVFSYAVSEASHHYALLVLPWVCLVLGWTYLVNDEKISAIGRYIRLTLAEKISDDPDTFGWETAHRDDPWRLPRKYFQWFIDEAAFCVSGWLALIGFWWLEPEAPLPAMIFTGIGAFLLLLLAIWIWLYANFIKGREALSRHT
ncbi:MAG: hypothetical protein GY862_22960 [Gammaproteobacteria bacterium]|nr:hypothetical protein [Gammaproteobacteria bacterium]